MVLLVFGQPSKNFTTPRIVRHGCRARVEGQTAALGRDSDSQCVSCKDQFGGRAVERRGRGTGPAVFADAEHLNDTLRGFETARIAEADSRARAFWLLFAVLDVVAAAGLVLFARSFGADTEDTRRRARGVMRGVYATVLLVGGVFLYTAFSSTPMQPRIAVQAAIFIALGMGGLLMGAGTRPPNGR